MKNSKPTILVVEDESSLLHALKEKLEHEGFAVIEAKNGEEGLKAALEEQPSLILLDIIMPKMDGLTMLEKLREDQRGKDIKVIMLTNLSDEEKLSDAISIGSHDYLIKSNWKISDVVMQIKEELKSLPGIGSV